MCNLEELKMNESIHEKAIRLIEGGIVEIDGHAVKLGKAKNILYPCSCCEIDSLCHLGNKMCLVCLECHEITGMDCDLILIETRKVYGK